MARCSAQIRQLEYDLPAVSTLERGRGLGSRIGHAGRDHGRQRPLQHRQHHRSRPRFGSGRKRGAYRRALGRSRGGFTSKLHCLADARGRPVAFHLTVGEAADCKAYDTLITLPEQAPRALLADKPVLSLSKGAMTPTPSEPILRAATSRRSSRAAQTAGSRSNMTGRSTGNATTSNASLAV